MEVAVANMPLVALLDTGVPTNAIPEEVVIEPNNNALSMGLKPEYRDLLVRLERRKSNDEIVRGIAQSQDIQGAVVLSVVCTGLDEGRIS